MIRISALPGSKRDCPIVAVCVGLGLVLLALAGCHGHIATLASTPNLGIEAIDPPALAGAIGANLANVDGTPWISWLEPAPEGQRGAKPRWRLRVARFAAASGAGWSAPTTVTEGENLLANWADFPAVSGSGLSAVAHWLVADPSAGGEAYSIDLAGTTDGGETWHPLGRLPADHVAAEHGFVSWLPERSGRGFRAFWLDGRGMPDGGAMSLRSARVDPEQGRSATANEELLDDRVCDCCQTDAAMTDEGPVVVYRDRSPEEIRDIAIRRLTPTGWSDGTLVHADGWRIEGCPVNGPAVAASGREVAVAWFTAVPAPRLLVAFSHDAGASFSPPIPIDTETPLGRVDLLLDSKSGAIVSWIGRETGGAQGSVLRLRRVMESGAGGPAIAIAKIDGGRASGFPRMLLSDRRDLLIAWTEPGSPGRLRAARVALSRLDQAAP